MILSSVDACGGASSASPLKYAAADLKNSPPFACSADRSFSLCGTFGMLWLILVKSVQKWPVSLAEGTPGTAAALAEPDPPPADEPPVPGALPPDEPPPHALSMRQAPATAAAIAETRGVDLMASIVMPSWWQRETGAAADGSVSQDRSAPIVGPPRCN